MGFGERLAEYAKRKHGAKNKFAEAVGMSQQQLNFYIHETKKPGYEILEKFFYDGMSVDWLLSGYGKPDREIIDSHFKDVSASNGEKEQSPVNTGELTVSRIQKVPVIKDYDYLKNLMKNVLEEVLSENMPEKK